LIISCSNKYEDKRSSRSGTIQELETGLATVNVNIADIKKEPRKHAERVSQALYNEIVDVLERNERYIKIRQWDGYIGWIRSYCLTENFDIEDSSFFMVNTYLAPAFEKAANNSRRRTMFPYGSRLSGEVEKDFLRVESERYGVVYVNLSDLLKETVSLYMIKPDSAGICREAEKFIGAPYLWGGKSFYGIDCSGLTQILMRRFGIELQRDSRDQVNQGIEIERDSVHAGDLLFFPNHVGLAVGKDLMVHSTGRNGGVAYNSLDPGSPIYSEYHDKNFITARRVFSSGEIK
jgi:cell wall-associated NlpC family hydrolase